MESISFCVATGVNEKEYLKLLLRSLKDNTELENHEILVWVDTDNQNTYEELIELQKTDFPMMRIGKNKYKSQLGSQLNSSVMAKEAKNEIICFLHSDMVVGRNFDKEILIALDNNPLNMVCNSRIEPPLHPASPEKIIKSFGMSPEEFEYDNFQQFSQELINENRDNEKGYFAPCTFYRDTFLNILGGFDTQFRCSREDSDFIIKLEMNNINQIISWKAIVYHFTCISSRGKDWWKKEEDMTAKVNWQKYADNVEMKRFIRKWGYFGHDYYPRYDVSLAIDVDCPPEINFLLFVETNVNQLILNDKEMVRYIQNHLKWEAVYYSNNKLGHIPEEWEEVKAWFPPTHPIEDRLIYSDSLESNSQVTIKAKMSDLIKQIRNNQEQLTNFFTSINKIVSTNDSGNFEIFENININIEKNLKDLNQNNIKNYNLDNILKTNTFIFK